MNIIEIYNKYYLPENLQSPNLAYHFKAYPDRGCRLIPTKGNFEKLTRRYVESIGLISREQFPRQQSCRPVQQSEICADLRGF